MSAPPLEITSLTVRYGANLALENANLTIAEGSFTGILGPNGAGKSTLLKACLGLEKSSGRALFYGRELKKDPTVIGYVPQVKTVDWDFPATAKDVVEMGTYGVKSLKKRTECANAVAEALKTTGITDLASRPIGKLSGGQRQRVFLARALVANPKLLLLDEPFSGVDAPSERFIMQALTKMQRQGTTIVAVHHDLNSAQNYFTHIALLNKTVRFYGPAHSILTPANIANTFEIPLLNTVLAPGSAQAAQSYITHNTHDTHSPAE